MTSGVFADSTFFSSVECLAHAEQFWEIDVSTPPSPGFSEQKQPREVKQIIQYHTASNSRARISLFCNVIDI
jgi:hypothetical protein